MSDQAQQQGRRFGAVHLSLFVAMLSLATAMYQGFLNTRSVGIFASDVARRETMRSCRDAVESFFEARLRIERLYLLAKHNDPAQPGSEPDYQARSAVMHFAAIATYLANYHVAEYRDRYTQITQALNKLIDRLPDRGFDAKTAIDNVQARFNDLNDDCARAAK